MIDAPILPSQDKEMAQGTDALKRIEFCDRYMEALKQWEIKHPGEEPPIRKDKNGEYEWVTTKQRRLEIKALRSTRKS